MPRSGGIYSLPPGYEAVTGETIQPSQHNPPLLDIAEALTGSLPRDGSAGMSNDLPMGNNQITGLGAGSSGSHAVRYDQTVRSATANGEARVPYGTLAAPAVQFSNTNNGIFWTGGVGPSYVASGALIGELTAGASLPSTLSIVTRQAGDARYSRASDAGGLETYAFLKVSGSAVIGFNDTVLGTFLSPSDSDGTAGAATILGSWKCMGYVGTTGTRATLFRRFL